LNEIVAIVVICNSKEHSKWNIIIINSLR
jgi:hypothetical protein